MMVYDGVEGCPRVYAGAPCPNLLDCSVPCARRFGEGGAMVVWCGAGCSEEGRSGSKFKGGGEIEA